MYNCTRYRVCTSIIHYTKQTRCRMTRSHCAVEMSLILIKIWEFLNWQKQTNGKWFTATRYDWYAQLLSRFFILASLCYVILIAIIKILSKLCNIFLLQFSQVCLRMTKIHLSHSFTFTRFHSFHTVYTYVHSTFETGTEN